MTLEQMAHGARPPWFSLDAVADEWKRAGLPVLTKDDMANIFECMNCRYPECIDCKGGGTGNPVGRPKRNSVQVEGQIGLF